jgi:hypothetical protein
MDEVFKTDEELSIEYARELDMNERNIARIKAELEMDLDLKIKSKERHAKFHEEARLTAELRLLRKKTWWGRTLNFYNKHKKNINFVALSIVSIPLCILGSICFVLVFMFYPFGYLWYYATNEIYQWATGESYDEY